MSGEHATSPFPRTDGKGREIVDEWCECGCLRSQHCDTFAFGHGHGHCLECKCAKFSWSSMRLRDPSPGGAAMKLKSIHEGKRVLYVPMHAHDDTSHPDCEHGVVTSWRGDTVFVRYTNRDVSVQPNAKSTSLSDLHEVP